MPAPRARKAAEFLAVPLLLLAAVPARAQLVPDPGPVVAEPAPGGEASQAVPGITAASAPTADGILTLGFLLGPGGGGIERGFRAGIGLGGGERVRVDLVGTLSGSTSTVDGAELMLGQGSVELVVSARRGRVRPFVGAGLQGGRATIERAGSPTDAPCVPLLYVCAPGEWTTESQEAEGSATGPVLSAGAHLAATERFLLAVEVRKAFVRPVPLAPVAERGDLGSVRVLASAIWRLGRSARPR